MLSWRQEVSPDLNWWKMDPIRNNDSPKSEDHSLVGCDVKMHLSPDTCYALGSTLPKSLGSQLCDNVQVLPCRRILRAYPPIVCLRRMILQPLAKGLNLCHDCSGAEHQSQRERWQGVNLSASTEHTDRFEGVVIVVVTRSVQPSHLASTQ